MPLTDGGRSCIPSEDLTPTAINDVDPPFEIPFTPSSHECGADWAEIEAELPNILAEFLPRVYTADEEDMGTIFGGFAQDHEIAEFLMETKLYSSEERKWTNIPEAPAPGEDLFQPFSDIINGIIKEFKIENREVFKSHSPRRTVHVQGCTNDATELKMSADFMVVAPGTGGMFQSTETGEISPYKRRISILEIKTEATRQIVENFLQAAVYAKQCFRQQRNRKHIYCVVLTEKRAEFYQFDHCGVMNTIQLDIHKYAALFVKMVLLISSDDNRVGFDTTVFYKGGDRYIASVDEGGDEVEYRLVVPKPVFFRRPIYGRGTLCWSAELPDGSGQHVIIKDSWRPLNREPESEILELVKGLDGVGQMIAYEESGINVSEFRRVAFHKLLASRTYMDRSFYRLILYAYGESINRFRSREHFLYGFRDAVAGHQNLWNKGVLHRDVSVANILFGQEGAGKGNRAVLIDLDRAIYLERGGLRAVDFTTGTRAFQSLAVLRSARRDSKNPPHDYLDDLESFLYVYAWVTLGFSAQKQQVVPMPEVLVQWENPSFFLASSVKSAFLSGQYLEPVTEYFGEPFQKLLESMKAFIRRQTRKKCTREEPIWHLTVLRKIAEEHYKTFLSFIDTAIAEMEAEGEEGMVPTGTLAQVLTPGVEEVDVCLLVTSQAPPFGGDKPVHVANSPLSVSELKRKASNHEIYPECHASKVQKTEPTFTVPSPIPQTAAISNPESEDSG